MSSQLPRFFRLYGGAEYDEPPRPLGEMAPHTYVIAASPRTGSTLLADGLRASGGLGVALEYLEMHAMGPYLMRRWAVPPGDMARYIAMLHSRRTGAEGWLGLKLHWHQLSAFMTSLSPAGTAPVDASASITAIELLFPGTRWIRLRRADRAAQAVSWFRARRSGSTVALADDGGGGRARHAPATTAELDEMVAYAASMARMDDEWDAALAGRGDVIDVTYEELDADLADAVGRVRRELGVGPGHRPEATIAKQRDAWSIATAERVRELLPAEPDL